MGQPLLEAKNLSCERDDRCLFRGLDLSLNAGDIIQLAGPNGSGKSTLLRILSGLFMSYEGQVDWRGQDRDDHTASFRRDVLYLGHRSGVKASLTPLENLRFMVGLHRAVNDRELMQALERVGLSGFEHSPSRNLSAGQQRRIALARLFLSEATIWLLDEMFTAIDHQGVLWFENYLSQQAEQGRAIVLTTHHALQIESVVTVQLGAGRP